MDTSKEILRLRNITKIYSNGGKPACHNISFAVNQGERVSLLGLNGAGKSTLIQIISTAITPTSGTAVVCGYDLSEKTRIKQKLGVLYEKNPLYENMRVREFLTFYQNMYGIRNTELIDSLCSEWYLTDAAQNKIAVLSNGYKQRVGLAAVLTHEPELLILDEPTSGLDAVQVTEFEKNIAEHTGGKTLLICTHDLAQALRLCNRHIVLFHGELIASGTINEIAQRLFTDGLIFEADMGNEKKVLETALSGGAR